MQTYELIRAKGNFLIVIKHFFLIFHACVCLVPFLWIVLSAFKDNTSIFIRPFSLPENFSPENFIKVWNNGGISVYFRNSLFISTITVCLQIFLVSMTSYVLTRLLLRSFLSIYYIFGLMIPVHALLLPNFLTIRNFGLMNNPLGVILVYCASGLSFGILLLSGFMKQIPRELDEASMIDGAGYIKIFFCVIFPLSKSGLATVATFAFLHSWNELLFAMVLLTRRGLMTITLGINSLKSEYITDYGLLCAGLLFAIVPVVIIYMLFQEHVVKSITAGAVKG